MLLTLYIECVAPGEYGVAKPWYFLFTFKFWLGKYEWFKKLKVKNNFLKAMFINSKEKIILEQEENNNNTKSISDSVEIVNENESNLEAGIEIIKLHKVYSRGNNHALKGLSLKFYKNEITAFLGHNGAGKSTTMHLLTGLYKPTSGTAKMNGLSISDSMDEIRKSLGKSLFK
jgi:ABC-type bacteriocin/lantibiotic exporter with double-glycine peptidase domain